MSKRLRKLKKQIRLYKIRKYKVLNKLKRLHRRRVNITVYINPKKCFNGCRVKKQIKKKRMYNILYK